MPRGRKTRFNPDGPVNKAVRADRARRDSRKAIDMAVHGASYTEIADVIGYADGKAAERAVFKAIGKSYDPKLVVVVQMISIKRIEAVISGLMKSIEAAEKRADDTMKLLDVAVEPKEIDVLSSVLRGWMKAIAGLRKELLLAIDQQAKIANVNTFAEYSYKVALAKQGIGDGPGSDNSTTNIMFNYVGIEPMSEKKAENFKMLGADEVQLPAALQAIYDADKAKRLTNGHTNGHANGNGKR